jgi:hypothetical protein
LESLWHMARDKCWLFLAHDLRYIFGTWFMVYHGCYDTFLRHIFRTWFETYLGDVWNMF